MSLSRSFLVALAGAGICTTAALQAQRGSETPPTGRVVAIGCVGREVARGAAAARPRYVITDARSTPPTVYRLDGDAANLEFHVGHSVEIGGTLSPATGNAPLVLKVASLTYLATTCPKPPAR